MKDFSKQADGFVSITQQILWAQNPLHHLENKPGEFFGHMTGLNTHKNSSKSAFFLFAFGITKKQIWRSSGTTAETETLTLQGLLPTLDSGL